MLRYNVLDLFAGVGGLSYGFSMMSQFNILLANELERDISIAYSLNHPGVKVLNCNISDLTEVVLVDALGKQSIDIVVGGPPCQSYSTLGNERWMKEQIFLCNIREFFKFLILKHLFLRMWLGFLV